MVFLVIWSIFLAAIAVTYDGSHLTMDLFSTRLAPRWQRALDGAIVAAVSILTFTFMAWQAMTVVRTLMRNDQRSIALDIPIAIAHSALLVGFVFSCRWWWRRASRWGTASSSRCRRTMSSRRV